MYHFCVCDIFFSPSGYPINSLFQCQYVFIRCFWWSIFPLNYQNTYGHQTFQGGDMQGGALAHKYAWYLKTNKTYLKLQKMYWKHNRQGANIVLEDLKHDPLIKWPTWGHVTAWKIFISIFVRFIANKFGRLLTLGRIFITQTLKSSPTSWFMLKALFVLEIFKFLTWHFGHVEETA